jgi:integrase
MAHIEKRHRLPCNRDGCAHGFAKHGHNAKGACTVDGCSCSRWITAPGDRETYRARYRDPSGRERNKSFVRKIDADRFVTKVEDAKHRGAYIDPDAGKVLFGAWAERWLEGKKALKPNTRRDYRNLLDHQVLPTFRDVPLTAIDDLAVEEWCAALVGAGLSTKRARKAHAVLFQALKAAVKGRKLAHNPAEGAQLPKLERREMHFLTAVQVEALAEAIDSRYRVLVLFAAYSGLRPAELAALKGRRLDLLAGTARVLESTTEVGGRLVTGSTKTYEHRTVKLPRFVCAELGAALKGRDDDPDAYVFTAPGGGQLRENNFMGRIFRPAIAAANAAAMKAARPGERPALIPEGLRMYDLRHTCASLLIHEQASVKAVQKQLGHKSAAMTLDVYGHLWPDETERLAERMDEAHAAAVSERSGRHGGPTVVTLREAAGR